jgi:hypothetical protein
MPFDAMRFRFGFATLISGLYAKALYALSTRQIAKMSSLVGKSGYASAEAIFITCGGGGKNRSAAMAEAFETNSSDRHKNVFIVEILSSQGRIRDCEMTEGA